VTRIDLESSSGAAINGRLEYKVADYSFLFTAAAESDYYWRLFEFGGAILAVGTLELTVDVDSGVIRYVDGYHPRTQWRAGSVCPGACHEGIVRVVDRQELISGVARSIASVGEWHTVHDRVSGWVRLSPEAAADDKRVLIASDTVLGLVGGVLNSIWLHPIFDHPLPL